jgi:hypothetical protein
MDKAATMLNQRWMLILPIILTVLAILGLGFTVDVRLADGIRLASRLGSPITFVLVLLFLAQQAFRAVRLRVILNRSITSGRLFAVVLIHQACAQLLPLHSGELALPELLARQQIRRADTLAALVLLRLCDLMMSLGLLFLAWSFLLSPSVLNLSAGRMTAPTDAIATETTTSDSAANRSARMAPSWPVLGTHASPVAAGESEGARNELNAATVAVLQTLTPQIMILLAVMVLFAGCAWLLWRQAAASQSQIALPGRAEKQVGGVERADRAAWREACQRFFRQLVARPRRQLWQAFCWTLPVGLAGTAFSWLFCCQVVPEIDWRMHLLMVLLMPLLAQIPLRGIAGLGTTEVYLILLYSTVGLEPSTALALALCGRAFHLSLFVIAGSAASLWLSRQLRRSPKPESEPATENRSGPIFLTSARRLPHPSTGTPGMTNSLISRQPPVTAEPIELMGTRSSSGLSAVEDPFAGHRPLLLDNPHNLPGIQEHA